MTFCHTVCPKSQHSTPGSCSDSSRCSFFVSVHVAGHGLMSVYMLAKRLCPSGVYDVHSNLPYPLSLPFMFHCPLVPLLPPPSLLPPPPQLKVTHKQLVLIHGAFAAYFSGNHEAVDTLLKEFQAKLNEERRGQDPPAWLEDLPSPRREHQQRQEQEQ